MRRSIQERMQNHFDFFFSARHFWLEYNTVTAALCVRAAFDGKVGMFLPIVPRPRFFSRICLATFACVYALHEGLRV